MMEIHNTYLVIYDVAVIIIIMIIMIILIIIIIIIIIIKIIIIIYIYITPFPPGAQMSSVIISNEFSDDIPYYYSGRRCCEI